MNLRMGHSRVCAGGFARSTASTSAADCYRVCPKANRADPQAATAAKPRRPIFVENDAIIPLSRSHHQATVRRVNHTHYLAVQDTTTCYTTHPCTSLGPICHTHASHRAVLHSTLAITPAGHMGFLHNAVRARDRTPASPVESTPAGHKKVTNGSSLAACQAVAPLCPNTLLVNITDREGDLYDCLSNTGGSEKPVEFLVRRGDRELAGSATLGGGRQPVARRSKWVGRGDHPSRLASLSIRFCAVQLKAPKRKASSGAAAVSHQARSACPKGQRPYCGSC
jgi:hypothetical protein